jgi:hypothetical protein
MKSAGVFAISLGLLLGSSFFLPRGEVGRQGLYRWANNGETKVVYGTNDTYYAVSTRAATVAAIGFLLLGGGLVLLGRRFRIGTPRA